MSTINERIARTVMGWTPETRKRYGGQDNIDGLGFNTHLSMGHPERHFMPLGVPVANYDTNPADAMSVLKVCGQKTAVAFERIPKELTTSGNEAWQIGAFEDGIYNRELLTRAPTFEQAACEFALKLFSPAAQAFNPDDK